MRGLWLLLVWFLVFCCGCVCVFYDNVTNRRGKKRFKAMLSFSYFPQFGSKWSEVTRRNAEDGKRGKSHGCNPGRRRGWHGGQRGGGGPGRQRQRSGAVGRPGAVVRHAVTAAPAACVGIRTPPWGWSPLENINYDFCSNKGLCWCLVFCK